MAHSQGKGHMLLKTADLGRAVKRQERGIQVGLRYIAKRGRS